jgi:hypothetical protein
MSLVNALKKVLYEPDAQQVQKRLRQRGEEVSARYLPEKILPQWEAFLERVISEPTLEESEFLRGTHEGE